MNDNDIVAILFANRIMTNNKDKIHHYMTSKVAVQQLVTREYAANMSMLDEGWKQFAHGPKVWEEGCEVGQWSKLKMNSGEKKFSTPRDCESKIKQ